MAGSDVLADTVRPNSPQDYAWVVTLARRKEQRYKSLTRISFIERPNPYGDASGTQPRNAAAVEWKYPLAVVEAFREANITLKVMLIPGMQELE